MRVMEPYTTQKAKKSLLVAPEKTVSCKNVRQMPAFSKPIRPALLSKRQVLKRHASAVHRKRGLLQVGFNVTDSGKVDVSFAEAEWRLV